MINFAAQHLHWTEVEWSPSPVSDPNLRELSHYRAFGGRGRSYTIRLEHDIDWVVELDGAHIGKAATPNGAKAIANRHWISQ